MKPLLVLVDHLSDWEPFLPSSQVLAIDDYLRDYSVTKGYVMPRL